MITSIYIYIYTWFGPQDDLSFKLEYVHPYLDGVNNPRNRTFKTSIFNGSKLSPVFTGGPGFEEAVAPILVDRAGVKATITEVTKSLDQLVFFSHKNLNDLGFFLCAGLHTSE